MEEKSNLINYHDCEIFKIAEYKNEEKFVILFANYNLGEFKTLNEAKKRIKAKEWDFILAVISIVIKIINDLKMEEKK